RGVDLGNRRFEPGLDDAVELDALPGRDPQRPVGVTVGERVEGEILLGIEPPARNADAHHELPDLAVAALLALGGAVAVVTLVDAVKLEEAVAGIVERRRGVGKVPRKIAAQLPALLLDRLGFREGLDFGHAAILGAQPARPLAVKVNARTSAGSDDGAGAAAR